MLHFTICRFNYVYMLFCPPSDHVQVWVRSTAAGIQDNQQGMSSQQWQEACPPLLLRPAAGSAAADAAAAEGAGGGGRPSASPAPRQKQRKPVAEELSVKSILWVADDSMVRRSKGF